MEYETYKEFFDEWGEDNIFPKIYINGKFRDFTIEEMFQHFKNRLVNELTTEHGDRLNGE